MASYLIVNALQVNFDSVLGFPDYEGMVNMFKALESIDLLGQGVGISEEVFARAFELPLEGLTDVANVPKDLVYDTRSIFSKSGEPVKTSCKKRKMKYEFRLLNDILANSITVKAGSHTEQQHRKAIQTQPSRNLSKPGSTLNYKLKIRTLYFLCNNHYNQRSREIWISTCRSTQGINHRDGTTGSHTLTPAADSNNTTNRKLKQRLKLRSQQQFEVLPQRHNTRPKTATSRSRSSQQLPPRMVQQLRDLALVNNRLQEWYRREELLERSPTLPRTYQTTVGNDGNSLEKLTVNSTRVQETEVDN
ncbi:centromere/kinetochore protein zw10 [Dorcoceras hygrometricum]|uniref:Centromere/kinetochore protein zw10 n=1 Tax=Dorcoceras hygrometricum TaxID=472368 RepID=A0A2Z7A7Q9_9LAMI|nr:centromere/kinetochore protein zw10 [Dorcoceras hygrometricum]